jgi:hypothetical protein
MTLLHMNSHLPQRPCIEDITEEAERQSKLFSAGPSIDRQRLGQILFYKLLNREDLAQTSMPEQDITYYEYKAILAMLGFETFIDCLPYGFMGLKDIQEGREVEGCYLD